MLLNGIGGWVMAEETTTAVETREFGSAKEFMDALLGLPTDTGAPDFRSPWVFRGHANADWKLQPPAFRSDGRAQLKPLIEWLRPQIEPVGLNNPNWRNLGPNEQRLLFECELQKTAEVLAIRQFCDVADELGLLIPGGDEIPPINEIFRSAFGNHPAMLLYWRRETGGNELFANTPFAFAQHHGIPTRYLDWSRDPLVAAYFAAYQASRTDPSLHQGSSVCVWAVKTGARTTTTEWVTVPRGQHHFLHAQHGLFSFDAGADQFFVSHSGQWPCFEDAATVVRGAPPQQMTKFVLPMSETGNLLRRLFEMRISRAHLMPTLDSVAATVRTRWEWYTTR
jgi:hypothetical protein